MICKSLKVRRGENVRNLVTGGQVEHFDHKDKTRSLFKVFQNKITSKKKDRNC